MFLRMTDELQQRSFCVIVVYRTFQLRYLSPSLLFLPFSYFLLLRFYVQMRRSPRVTERREDWPSDPDEAEEGREEEGREERRVEFITSSGTNCPLVERAYVQVYSDTRGEGRIKGREGRARRESAVTDNRIKSSAPVWREAWPRKLNRLGLSFG